MKVTVFGLGYVGMSNAALLAQNHSVVGVDLDAERVDLFNQKTSPVVDEELSAFLVGEPLDLRATTDGKGALKGAELVIVATQTNYDADTNSFNTNSVDFVVRQAIEHGGADTTIVIKSTIPVGYVAGLRAELGTERILFSPEFLREGRALHDNLHPSRIVVGDATARGRAFADLMIEGANIKDVAVN